MWSHQLPSSVVFLPLALQARISGLENEITVLRVDLKSSQDKAQSAQKEIEALERVRGWLGWP